MFVKIIINSGNTNVKFQIKMYSFEIKILIIEIKCNFSNKNTNYG